MARFVRTVRDFYRANGRDFPWRRTRDPYRILVSEIMLQQTQTDRVIPKYREFLKAFPSVTILVDAPLSSVLCVWSGLGYNRRAKLFKACAEVVVREHGGKLPRDAAVLRTLPGIGPYTAGAVAAFAYNASEVFIETNIRTVFLHHFFADKKEIADAQILPLIAQALAASRMEPREWYWALMDYGAHLKRSGVRLNAHSRHYAKQSKFEGSRRQLRGHILRLLLEKSRTEREIVKESGREAEEVRDELARLQKENLIQKKKSAWSIA